MFICRRAWSRGFTKLGHACVIWLLKPSPQPIPGVVAGGPRALHRPYYFGRMPTLPSTSRHPDLERFMAKRMGAKTIEIEASHLALISHPDAITSLMLEALAV